MVHMISMAGKRPITSRLRALSLLPLFDTYGEAERSSYFLALTLYFILLYGVVDASYLHLGTWWGSKRQGEGEGRKPDGREEEKKKKKKKKKKKRRKNRKNRKNRKKNKKKMEEEQEEDGNGDEGEDEDEDEEAAYKRRHQHVSRLQQL